MRWFRRIGGTPCPTGGVARRSAVRYVARQSPTMSKRNESRNPVSGSRGFTLIELMVTIAIVAILAAVALPSFLDSIRKGRRSDAVAALAAVQQAQERWRSNRNAYTAQLTASASADPPGLGQSATSAKGYYAISIDAAGNTNYTVTATATTGTSQAGDGACQRLRVRVDGGNIIYGSATAVGEFDESATNPCWAR
jgi:type IV pilus assembly protein PilE